MNKVSTTIVYSPKKPDGKWPDLIKDPEVMNIGGLDGKPYWRANVRVVGNFKGEGFFKTKEGAIQIAYTNAQKAAGKK